MENQAPYRYNRNGTVREEAIKMGSARHFYAWKVRGWGLRRGLHGVMGGAAGGDCCSNFDRGTVREHRPQGSVACETMRVEDDGDAVYL